jgi:hypothetical protein
MTLSARNYFFKTGIVLAAISLGIVAFCGYLSYPAFPRAAGSSALRSQGIIQLFIERLTNSSAYVPFWTMICATAYSLISIVLIHKFFEKTQSPEILFIGLFVISLAFEFARIAIPFKMVFYFPAKYLVAASRVLLFGRYFGLFSLFAASVYAAGYDSQKQQNLFIMLVLAALVIALNVPVDRFVWDSTFMIWNGYRSMLSTVELGVLVVSVLTFFISAHTRGSQTFILIGIGAFLTLAGRNLLINSDTWITPLPGLAILIAGTWFICSRLRLEYLWL